MTPKKLLIAHEVDTGKTVEITTPNIIGNRVLLEGDSGSGKSHLNTVFIEQTAGEAQRIVIDLEGEYPPLKDHFQFLLIGKETDIVKPNVELNINDIYIDKLVEKLIDRGVDAIIDLSEFPNDVNHIFVVFKKAIFKYAKLMKRPLIIFVDEAHVIAPEVGKGGKESEESAKALKELAKRGRKRGIGVVCATQAIADFSKDVVRQLRLRFIGNCTLESDIKAAARTLGFGKHREHELKELAEDHHFFLQSIGSAITVGGRQKKDTIKIKAINTNTKLYVFDFNKSFKIKEKNSKKLQNIAQAFSDIPKMIDEELSQKERLQKENFDLKKKTQQLQADLGRISKVRPAPDQNQMQTYYQKGYKEGSLKTRQQLGSEIKKLQSHLRSFKPIINRVVSIGNELANTRESIVGIDDLVNSKLPDKTPLPKEMELPVSITARSIPNTTMQKPSTAIPSTSELDSKPKKGAMKMLKIIAMFQKPVTKQQVATMSGFSMKGGTFNTYLSELRKRSWIEVTEDEVSITDTGLEYAGDVEPLPSDPDTLVRMWAARFKAGAANMLKAVADRYPNGINKEELGEITGFTPSGGTFNTYLSQLRKNGLVEIKDDDIIASKELFPMELC